MHLTQTSHIVFFVFLYHNLILLFVINYVCIRTIVRFVVGLSQYDHHRRHRILLLFTVSFLKIKNREFYPGVKISIVNEIICTSRGGFCVNSKTDHIRERIWHVLGHLRGYPCIRCIFMFECECSDS